MRIPEIGMKGVVLCVLALSGFPWMAPPVLQAQVVEVTMSLDSKSVFVGGTTMLRVFAQVIPAQQAASERIFSWFVDVHDANGAIASADYAAMLKTASDQESPPLSSIGTQDGANRVGIYDTFLNLPGAGVAEPVELIAIPVTGLAAGKVGFSVHAGTGEGPSNDFLVAPLVGDVPLTGGIYNAANVELEVFADVSSVPVKPSISVAASGGTLEATIAYQVIPGLDYVVEFRDDLGSAPDWQPLPEAPHDSGIVTDISAAPSRFYRVMATASQ